MFKNQVVIGSLYALCATVLWAGAFIIARLAVGEISPTARRAMMNAPAQRTVAQSA